MNTCLINRSPSSTALKRSTAFVGCDDCVDGADDV